MTNTELSDQLAKKIAKGGMTKQERVAALHAWAAACKAILAGFR